MEHLAEHLVEHLEHLVEHLVEHLEQLVKHMVVLLLRARALGGV